MKHFIAGLLLVASTAFAGERLLGIIQELGSSSANTSQNPDGGSNVWDGGYIQPFCIPEMAKLTVQCSADEYICTDKTTCTATEGLKLLTDVALPTSVGGTRAGIYTAGVSDGGVAGSGSLTRCAVVSVVPVAGDGGYHGCKIFERTGRE